MDVDRIQQEMDVKTLQNNIMHVTFCNIEAELVSYKIDQVGIQFCFFVFFSMLYCVFLRVGVKIGFCFIIIIINIV